METQKRILCNHCKTPIEPCKGRIVQGNIYMITDDLNERGGLIGTGRNMDKHFKDVEEMAFCDKCLMECLGGDITPRKKTA